jgi:hypothetical protein
MSSTRPSTCSPGSSTSFSSGRRCRRPFPLILKAQPAVPAGCGRPCARTTRGGPHRRAPRLGGRARCAFDTGAGHQRSGTSPAAASCGSCPRLPAQDGAPRPGSCTAPAPARRAPLPPPLPAFSQQQPATEHQPQHPHRRRGAAIICGIVDKDVVIANPPIEDDLSLPEKPEEKDLPSKLSGGNLSSALWPIARGDSTP